MPNASVTATIEMTIGLDLGERLSVVATRAPC